jgi:hypothetical protein
VLVRGRTRMLRAIKERFPKRCERREVGPGMMGVDVDVVKKELEVNDVEVEVDEAESARIERKTR